MLQDSTRYITAHSHIVISFFYVYYISTLQPPPFKLHPSNCTLQPSTRPPSSCQPPASTRQPPASTLQHSTLQPPP